MRIRILGCWGGLSKDHRTVGFLVDGWLLLDAGTAVTALEPAEVRRITDVVLSHAHLDHIKELPFLMGDSQPETPLRLHGTARVLANVRRHLFNGQIWPDFSIVPSRTRPYMVYRKLRAGEPAEIADISVTPIPVNHTIPCTGMILRRGDTAIAWTSDTGPTDRIWRAARRNHVKAVFVEVSYPNAMGRLALLSGHLTPNLLLAELRKLDMPGVPLYVYHMKPEHADRIRRELMAIKNPVIALEQGHTYEF